VANGNRLGEGHVQTEWARYRPGNLCDFKGMSEPCPLVVVGEDEDLRLPGEASERRGVQDAVAVALEAGAYRRFVFVLIAHRRATAGRARRQRGGFNRFEMLTDLLM